MKQIFTSLFVLVVVLGFSVRADADLDLRGEGTSAYGTYRLIYDSDLNITWYDFSRSFDTWQNQMDWASALTVTFEGTVYDDWRLPSSLNSDGTGPCTEYNCNDSEMGHLYYTELGNKAYNDFGWGLNNTDDFQNIQPRWYWSSTDRASDPGMAGFFGTYFGQQGYDVKDSWDYAIAVRDGDVTIVPEPISSILFLTGGATLIGKKYIRRKKIEI